MTARWSIVSTMHGVPETVLPCIAHHLQSDAEFLHIYLDAPNPVVQEALSHHPRCIVTVCDDAYWVRRPNGRPQGLGRRQRANLRHAMRRASSDWLVHLDSDEFLVPAKGSSRLSLGEELDSIPPGHDWGRIAPLERILPPGLDQKTIFDGVFRIGTTDKETIRAAYGPGADYLTDGLSGHTRGKIAFRRNTTLTPRIHGMIWPQPKGTRPKAASQAKDLPPFTPITATQLLHFEGWTALQWARKLMRFVEDGRLTHHNKGRRAAIDYMSTHPGTADRDALFDRVQKLSEHGFELLNQRGLLRLDPFNPIDVTRAAFPELTFDFSVAAFDARSASTAQKIEPLAAD